MPNIIFFSLNFALEITKQILKKDKNSIIYIQLIYVSD